MSGELVRSAERRRPRAAPSLAPLPGLRLLESLLWEPDGGYLLLDEHLARLAGSARRFGFGFDEGRVRRHLAGAAEAAAGPAKVRLLLDAAGRPDIERLPLRPAAHPPRVRLAREPVDSRDPYLYHKTTRRGVYDTRLAAHPGFDDVVLVNERGELTESTIANLVLEMDGRRWTPPVESGLLPGVFRGALLRDGAIRERVLRPADLLRADAVYLVNSVRRWRRAVVEPR